jgi:1,4-dihydroxy-2-naphthoate octaprenyltransferase
VFPKKAEERNVLVEMIPAGEWTRPNILRRWLPALRIPYLLFSVLPLLLVLSRSLAEGIAPSYARLALMFSSLILIHLGCNLWGEYEDHLRGVDSPDQLGGTGVIEQLWIPAVHVRNAGAALFCGGCALGLFLFAELPWSIVGTDLLWLGLLGALGAASYSGWPFHYKYLGLGEPIVFLLSGPIVTMGAALICNYDVKHFPWYILASLPHSFLATLRLHGGNMQRVPVDTGAGVFTIARALGFPGSKWAYGFLLLAPFLSVAALALAQVLPPATALVFAAFPYSVVSLSTLRRAKGPLDPAFHELRKFAVRLHFSLGLLYSLSFLLPVLFERSL